MKEIVIGSGHTIMVDDEDYDRVSAIRWRARQFNRVLYVTSRTTGVSHSNRKEIRLHRFILGITDPKIDVDHENHNGLDGQKKNLRRCTPQQNARNQRMSLRNKIGYKGVRISRSTHRGKLYEYISAQIVVDGKQIHLGHHPSFESAAHAYDVAATRYFGDFACLNFPTATQ